MSDFIIKNGLLIKYTGNDIYVEIPNGVAEIGNSAFAGQAIAKVTIPEGVWVIENRAFYECIHLTEVVIPKSVKLIEQRAFGFCRTLKSITVPTGVEHIEPDAFIGCDHLPNM